MVSLQEIASLVRQSSALNEKDKKKVLELLPNLDEKKQRAVKAIFEEEKIKRQQLAEQKSRAIEILQKIQAEAKNKIRLKSHETAEKIEKKQKEKELMEMEQIISKA